MCSYFTFSNFHPPKMGVRAFFPKSSSWQISPPGVNKVLLPAAETADLSTLFWGCPASHRCTSHVKSPLVVLENKVMKYKGRSRLILSFLLRTYPAAECASCRAQSLWCVPLFCYWSELRLFVADVHPKSAGLCVLQETGRWRGRLVVVVP